MRTLFLVLWCSGLFLSIPRAAISASLSDPVVSLHFSVISSKIGDHCIDDVVNDVLFPPCESHVVDRSHLEGWGVYMLVARADSTGVESVTFGIEHPSSLLVLDWFGCTDSEVTYGGWPYTSGSGLRASWTLPDNCQRETKWGDGVKTVVGAFYVYAYDSGELRLTPNTAAGEDSVHVANCELAEIAIPPDHVARVGFGTAMGYNPCLPATPVDPTTWGRIKSLN